MPVEKKKINRVRTPMAEVAPNVRNRNFEEVALGYTLEEAQLEAARCLHCKQEPCRSGCPVVVQIPQFLAKIEAGDIFAAYDLIKATNSLPAVCGRVCPQETQCEGRCVIGKKGSPVAIGRLERFAADYVRNNPQPGPKSEPVLKVGKKVAVIGGGPAGLTCAADLALAGVDVTIYESLHKPGGVLVYGIPEFRLPKSIVEYEVEQIAKMGVEILPNMVIGKIASIEELRKEHGFDAFFIGTGAGLPYFLQIAGEELNGVYSANEFLTRTNLMKAYDPEHNDTPVALGDTVAVLGAGNVAMDAARVSVRLGAKKVYIVYRRAREQMPARLEELHHAEEEGVEFVLLTNPLAIIGNEDFSIKALQCQKMELGEPDDSGRRRPIPIAGSEFMLDVDTVVVAIGQGPNPLLTHATEGLELNRRGNIVVTDAGLTSLPGVYAGGDIVTGAATVILAMGAGKVAAEAILNDLGVTPADKDKK